LAARLNYLLIAIVIGPLVWKLAGDYKQGVAWAVFLFVSLSANPVILSGGGLPNFSLQRIILMVLLLAAIKKSRSLQANPSARFMGVLTLYALLQWLPLVFTVDLWISVKAYLSFTVEILLFYWIITSSIQSIQDARRIVMVCAGALVTVGVLALVERFAHFNPVDAFMPGYVRKPLYENDVLSTFPHRILLGTGMAMGWPLALAFAQAEKARRWLWWSAMSVLLLACYVSFSRGPWIAAVFAGMGMFLLAGARVRRQALAIVALAIVVLVARPGVWDTLSSSVNDTTNADSFKGQTYQYRWELWGIAWRKISISPTRMLFGFGQGSTEVLTFETELSYMGESTSLWSWDNHYAATLFETGLVGLASMVGLYAFFLTKLVRARASISEENKPLHAAVTVSLGALLFMMTNVALFAPQLNYLAWALIPAGLKLGEGANESEIETEEGDYAIAAHR
jgi:O-Antigen ligase